MHYVPAYLRPLSQLNIGTESMVDQKAEKVQSIKAGTAPIEFEQKEELLHWRYREALEGKTVIERGDRVKRGVTVDHPDRHWWIISRGVLEDLDPPLRSEADILDFLLALNICIDAPVFFAQDPGQVFGGAFRVHDGALDYRDDFSPGSFPLALLANNEIPEQVTIKRDITLLYELVRKFRSMRIDEDADSDIRVALHMYEDALGATVWTAMTNCYYVCENLLCAGKASASERDQQIEAVTGLTKDEAAAWRKLVNRLKHPDKGVEASLVSDEGNSVPTVRRIREAANAALVHEMSERYDELDLNP